MGLQTETERRLADLSKVLEVTRAMTAEKDLGKLLAMLVHRTSEVMHAERSTLFLVDAERDELWSKVAEGDGFTEIRFPLSSGLAGHCARTGQTIDITDAYEDERFNPEIDRRTGFRTRSVLCMPLRDFSGEIVGVIEVLNKRGPGGPGGEFTPYDEWLLGALSAQAGVSLSQAVLLEHYVEKKRMQRDLELASVIQKGLIPEHPPEVEGLEFATHFASCDETGGDYLDFLEPVAPSEDGAGVGAVIADVSGHGLPAALVMSAVRATVHALWLHGLGPAGILERANELLCPDLVPDRFVSAFLVAVAPGGGLRYASAGHEPPLVWRASTGEFETLEPTGLILGVLEEAEYAEGTAAALRPGDVLVITTDGVFEARSPSGEMFGRERLRGCIQEAASRGAAAVAGELASALSAHGGDSKQDDDITFIVVGAR